MEGYVYKSTWNERTKTWSEKKLVSAKPITEERFNELNYSPELINKKYGSFIVSKDFNTVFYLLDDNENTIDFMCLKEKLPWD